MGEEEDIVAPNPAPEAFVPFSQRNRDYDLMSKEGIVEALQVGRPTEPRARHRGRVKVRNSLLLVLLGHTGSGSLQMFVKQILTSQMSVIACHSQHLMVA